MMHHSFRKRRLARAVTQTGFQTTGSALSSEITGTISRRFSAAALIYGFAYLFAFGIGMLLNPQHLEVLPISIACAFILGALVTSALVRHRTFSPRAIRILGPLFCFVGGVGIMASTWGWETQMAAAIEQLPPIPEPVMHALVSKTDVLWICVWILVFPLLVPLSFGRMVVTVVSTGALAVAIPLLSVAVHGLPESISPFLGDLVLSSGIQTAICVGIAVLASRVIFGMARDLTRAKRMGSYELIHLVGRGGMGEVWTARHQMLTRPAAIKLIRPDALARASQSSKDDVERILKRFEREVQATALLGSPHTIQIYDFGATGDGAFYYVMEFLKGLDLQTLVERFGPLETERVVCMLCQVCHSLTDAHSTGLIHRDIKPANIFACCQGQDFDFMKVLDFGLVKDISDRRREETQLTADGIASGTPSYMAPEMAYGNRPIDARTDLYALGCVAWWLLTGRSVFEGETPIQMVLKHVNEQPEPPSRYTEIEVPEEMDNLVLACLEKEPANRPQTAGEMIQRLERIGCADRVWTPERAEQWWKTNLSDLLLEDPERSEDEPGRADPDATAFIGRNDD